VTYGAVVIANSRKICVLEIMNFSLFMNNNNYYYSSLLLLLLLLLLSNYNNNDDDDNNGHFTNIKRPGFSVLVSVLLVLIQKFNLCCRYPMHFRPHTPGDEL